MALTQLRPHQEISLSGANWKPVLRLLRSGTGAHMKPYLMARWQAGVNGTIPDYPLQVSECLRSELTVLAKLIVVLRPARITEQKRSWFLYPCKEALGCAQSAAPETMTTNTYGHTPAKFARPNVQGSHLVLKSRR